MFLLLGAIVNVAVAWSLAASSELKVDTGAEDFRGYSIERLTSGEHWTLIANGSRDGLMILSFIEAEDLVEGMHSDVLRRLDADGAPRFNAPSWSKLAIAQPRPGDPYAVGFAVAYGWPLLSNSVAFRSSGQHQRLRVVEMTGIIVGDEPTKFVPPTSLPLRPIWPGFAINTVFYAGILWLLFAAPFALRRHRRIKRGLCPACAYPVGASDVCTDCGGPVKPRRGAGM